MALDSSPASGASARPWAPAAPEESAAGPGAPLPGRSLPCRPMAASTWCCCLAHRARSSSCRTAC
eukprot:15464560-Alexandrium_andersonii.AAC.1